MLNRVFPPGFILPAQPVKRPGPPCGPSWVHEIKHDGYRLIVLKGDTVRLFTRSGNDWAELSPFHTGAYVPKIRICRSFTMRSMSSGRILCCRKSLTDSPVPFFAISAKISAAVSV
jgi:hypothetical protein